MHNFSSSVVTCALSANDSYSKIALPCREPRAEGARGRESVLARRDTCSTESRSAPGAPSAFTIHLSRSVCPTQPRPRPTPEIHPGFVKLSLRLSRLGEAHPAIRSVPLVILTMPLFGVDFRFEIRIFGRSCSTRFHLLFFVPLIARAK